MSVSAGPQHGSVRLLHQKSGHFKVLYIFEQFLKLKTALPHL